VVKAIAMPVTTPTKDALSVQHPPRSTVRALDMASAMEEVELQALRADYKEAVGTHARGAMANDARWLQRNIDEASTPGPASAIKPKRKRVVSGGDDGRDDGDCDYENAEIAEIVRSRPVIAEVVDAIAPQVLGTPRYHQLCAHFEKLFKLSISRPWVDMSGSKRHHAVARMFKEKFTQPNKDTTELLRWQGSDEPIQIGQSFISQAFLAAIGAHKSAMGGIASCGGVAYR
jgi:hypothetical protein